MLILFVIECLFLWAMWMSFRIAACRLIINKPSWSIRLFVMCAGIVCAALVVIVAIQVLVI